MATSKVAYVCENGHENSTFDETGEKGGGPRCKTCSGLVVVQRAPMYQCVECGHHWSYEGHSDRVTCPRCKGKRTGPVADE